MKGKKKPFNYKKLISFGKAFVAVRLLKKRVPLFVSWAITRQCNRRCAYCGLWENNPAGELSTRAALFIIDALGKLGTKVISFTGGEPLLRQDIGRLLAHAHAKGIETKMNSNGDLAKARIDELVDLDVLTLSLDGPQDIHDAIRGEGSYHNVMQAAQAARSCGIKIEFATVITKANIGYFGSILEKAKEYAAKVTFQPATVNLLGGGSANPLVPSQEAYWDAIDKLIMRKSRGERRIGNSIACLRHLRNWPNPTRIQCASGSLSLRIEPNGDVLYCSRMSALTLSQNAATADLPTIFAQLKPLACDQCWCASRVELNLLASLSIGAVIKQRRELLWRL